MSKQQTKNKLKINNVPKRTAYQWESRSAGVMIPKHGKGSYRRHPKYKNNY